MKVPVRIARPLGPLGPIEASAFASVWKDGTNRAVTCQICGTRHPKRNLSDDSYWLGTFLGNTVVAECCGKIFALAYAENGTGFAMARLDEFKTNPLSDSEFLGLLANSVDGAKRLLAGTLEMSEQMSQDLDIVRK